MIEKTKCDFCDITKIGEKKIIANDTNWYAFIPQDPEIFGHTVVTVNRPHVREIVSKNGSKIKDVLRDMAEGIKDVADILIKISKVQRVYIAMLGETDPLHMHYHLFPRYGFINELEITEWSKKYRLTKGSIEWQKFYAQPTLGFKSFTGFQYLGEIEKSYEVSKKRIGYKPEEILIEEMVERISPPKRT